MSLNECFANWKNPNLICKERKLLRNLENVTVTTDIAVFHLDKDLGVCGDF